MSLSLKNERLLGQTPEGCSLRSNEGSESSPSIGHESRAAVVPSRSIVDNDDQTSHIPDEILYLIFLFSLPSDRPPAMVIYDAPLSLSQVCRRWRSLAHSIPELWTSVHLLLAYFRPGAFDNVSEDGEDEGRADSGSEIQSDEFQAENEGGGGDGDDEEEDEEETEEHRLRLQEERILAREDTVRLPFIQSWFSRTRPTDSLHLSISDELIFSNFSSCITDFVLTLLDRVESLDLTLCRRTFPRFTEFRPRVYERLRKLRLAGDGFDTSEWSFLLYDAPDLVEFDIRALRFPVASLPLNWSGLTRLAVSYFNNPADAPSVDALVSLLRRTPRLQSLRMVVRGDVVGAEDAVGGAGLSQQEEETEEERTTLPDLHTFELEFTYSPKRLFDSLALPSLARIQLVEDRRPRYPPVPPTPSSALLPLLSSQKLHGRLDRIQKIEFEAVYYPPSTVIKCLAMTPGLRHLVCLAPLSNCDRRVFERAHNSENGRLGFDDEVLDALSWLNSPSHLDTIIPTSTCTSGSTSTSISTESTSKPTFSSSITSNPIFSANAQDNEDIGPLCRKLECLEILDSRYDWLHHTNRSREAMVRFLRLRSRVFFEPQARAGGLAKLKKVVLPKAWIPSEAKEEGVLAEFCSLRNSGDVKFSAASGNGEEGGEGEIQRGWLREGYWSDGWYQA